MTTVAARTPVSESRDGYTFTTDLPHTLGRPAGWRAKIGMIVLANDVTVEYEVSRIVGLDGVATYTNRIVMDPVVTAETLAAMESRITPAVELLLPGEDLDVIAYCCTSGTTTIGKEKVFERIRTARPGVACTTPIVAGVAGAQALGLRRLALLTPYEERVTLGMRDFLLGEGLEVPVVATFNNRLDAEVARISEESLMAAILDAGRTDVDGVFVSCTSLHVTGVIEECEEALGKPVMSSNQALAWHCLRLAGVEDVVAGYGRLLEA